MVTYEESYNRVLNQKGRRSGGQIYYFCPFDGCVGYDKRKFNINAELGGFYCFHCEESGSYIEFAERMNDDISLWPSGRLPYTAPKVSPLSEKQRKKVWTSLFKNGYLIDEHKEELENRGLTPRISFISSIPGLFERMVEEHGQNTIIRAGIGYLNKDVLLPRTCVQVGRLLIPYVENDEVYFFVGYQRCPPRRAGQSTEEYQDQKQNWVKVASPAGYSPAIYGDINKEGEYLIVTEGQLKAEAAIQRGFPCVGLQGMSNSHSVIVKKCKNSNIKRAIILFDTQTDDQGNIDWFAEKLGRELLQVGIPSFKATLPLEEGKRKTDIDTFLYNHSTEEFIEVLKNARPYKLIESSDVEEEEIEEEV